MQQLYKTLPDDRPITSINVIEDPDKCPSGFIVVSILYKIGLNQIKTLGITAVQFPSFRFCTVLCAYLANAENEMIFHESLLKH